VFTQRGASIGLSLALTIIVGGALVWDRIYRIPDLPHYPPPSPGALLVIEHGASPSRGCPSRSKLSRGAEGVSQVTLRSSSEHRERGSDLERRRTSEQGGLSVQFKTHLVRKGESLSTIALKFYRRSSRWPEIARANNLFEPFLIRAGQTLKIP